MTPDRLRSYRFETTAQWNSCLRLQADPDGLEAGGRVRPFAPFGGTATRYGAADAEGRARVTRAPVVTRVGAMLWRDDSGMLYRLSKGDETPARSPAPLAIARASRIVATTSGLWVAVETARSVELFEADSLARLATADFPDARVVDIAADGERALVLVQRGKEWQVVRVDRAGRRGAVIVLEAITDAAAFVFLRRSQRIVVLAGDRHQRLYWFNSVGGEPIFSKSVAQIRPCFAIAVDECGSRQHVLGSDARDRILLAGFDAASPDESASRSTPRHSAPLVLLLDADGNLLRDIPLDQRDAPTGVTATRAVVLVTGRRGVLRYDVANSVPEGAPAVACTLITPVLQSPDRADARRWLRVEAVALLPTGCTLELAYAATDDDAIRKRLHDIATDEKMTQSHRVQRLLNEPEIWHTPTAFQGSAAAAKEAASFAARLFDVKKRFLWVRVMLRAGPGACLPTLSRLTVLYPGRTLMEHLPGIYQREEDKPESFLRSLVGVLEATTQGLDAEIASIGRNAHPSTATVDWLNFTARWLGVPWDDAFTETQKRAILMRAADLAHHRGTRTGLEMLLGCLITGTPARFRVTDATADFGFAMVGGAACAGSALPALLGGYTRWHAELDSRAVLGYLRLPCDGQVDDGVRHWTGKVRVDLAATAEERMAWEPWMDTVISAMIPLTARLELHWVSPYALRTSRLDGTLTLDLPPSAHLGSDAVIDLARLPERSPPLSDFGTTIGTRLR
jgi:phage tail-like protein